MESGSLSDSDSKDSKNKKTLQTKDKTMQVLKPLDLSPDTIKAEEDE